jgi:hypothetical protein
MFGPKNEEVVGGWKRLHNEKLHNLHASPNIIRVINSRKRMKWVGHVACTGEKRNTYKMLVKKPEGKKPFGRLRCRWEDNIKMDLKEIDWKDVNWIHLAQDREQWRTLVTMVVNLQVTQKALDFQGLCST